MSKNLDETVRLQSEIRREWIREIRGERLQGIAEGASSAPRLASSSAVSFPGRNECLGAHCSLIEQERENSSCQICRLQRKNLSILGLLKRKEWPQCHRDSSWQEHQSRPYQKEKEQSRLSKAPDHEAGESQGGRERGGSEREHGVGRVDSTVNEGRFQGGQGGQATRASLEQVERSMSG